MHHSPSVSFDFLNLSDTNFQAGQGFGQTQWLANFAYRVDIGWWVFIVAGVAALLIALLTISFQSIKAAIANPVKSLRTE